MENNSSLPQEITRFEIIFEKLEEAKREQSPALRVDLESISETTKTIMLFREFQESIQEASYVTFTKT